MELNEFFYQHYWWFIISLLGALLVFLLFVQGGQTLLTTIAKKPIEKTMLVNSLGRKWEFTFTTLVVFGGAFFASFPLFYSTSFGGAYWLWMAILFSFIIQAVSYEYRSRKGNLLGTKVYDIFLLINGVVGIIFSLLIGIDPLTQLLTGGLLLGSIFMATDYVTSPMSHKGMIIYGVAIGLLTIIIRQWAAYPEGMSFAILIMNAFTPLINMYVKPKRFGEVVKHG